MKKNLSLIISFIGIVSIAGGLLLIKTLENPNEFILTLSYICIGVGCGVFGHGMGNFVAIKTVQNNAEIKKQMDIVRKDERNIAISNRAKAKAYDLMTYTFGALLLIFTLMGVDLIPLLLLFKEQMPEIFGNIEYDTEFNPKYYAKLTVEEDV
mgnify:CR=1 FL=1|jgi:hypothetical protein